MLGRLYKALVPSSLRSKLKLGNRLRKVLIPVKLALGFPAKKKLKKIRFEIHLAEHCNLNCAGCNHFSPLADTELVDVEEFERDIKRMGQLFNHECERIFLIGGEPLLHPEIVTLMKTARENFTSGDITIYTNGILLPQKDSEFWQACHDNDVKILISVYPINLNRRAIEETARKFNVSVGWSSAPEGVLRDSSFMVSPIDISGKGNIRKNFAYCFESNRCITLKHGKLFTCVFAAHVHHFSKKFGVDIPITNKDSIDIYEEDINDRIILDRLNRPISACRFCSGGRFTKSSRKITWHHTEYKINEWI